MSESNRATRSPDAAAGTRTEPWFEQSRARAGETSTGFPFAPTPDEGSILAPEDIAELSFPPPPREASPAVPAQEASTDDPDPVQETSAKPSPELPLDLIGIAEGTDKHSLHHDYLRHYERIFAPFRHQPIDLVEIGVFKGGSLRTWRRFFSRARIIGLDLDPACMMYSDPDNGVFIEIGSQDDPGVLMRLCQQYRPSIIIDDGSHLANHIQFTFERLFPALLPGGYYVIEDFMFHFGSDAERHIGDATTALPDFLMNTVHRKIAGDFWPHHLRSSDKYFATWIDSVEVFRYAATIRKKERLGLSGVDLEAIEGALERAGRSGDWHGYAVRLMDSGLLDRAEQAALRGVEVTPDNWLLPATLADVRERRGDLKGALSAVEESMKVATGEAEIAFLRNRESSLRQRGAS